MLTKHLQKLLTFGTLLLATALPAAAGEPVTIAAKGSLRFAVYNNFPPYSFNGKGIDVEIAQAIAKKLGVRPEIAWFNADEDMNDDLRNMVWKGHYLGTQPADVMMHVPVDVVLARANDKVRIFGPYHRETMAYARNSALIPPLSGSAAVALEVFTREKVGVEVATLADDFLLSALNGRLKDNVVHYKTVAKAAAGLRAGEVSAVMAPRAELEAAVNGAGSQQVEKVSLKELKVASWPLGMATKVENAELADAVAGALAALERDGTVKQIFSQYGITHQTSGD